MKYINILICIITLYGVTSCYKDKGNYNYKEVNELQVEMTPIANSYNDDLYIYYYNYRQPSKDTLTVTYTPQIVQTLSESDENIDIEWIVSKIGVNKKDTVKQKNLTLKFAPKVKTEYTVLFKATDKTNQISIHRQLNLKTQVPFIGSWFVLHGQPNDRKLGTIEYPNSGNDAEILLDTYHTIHGLENPFKEVNDILYLSANGSNYNTQENINMLSPTESKYMHAFDMNISDLGYNLMVPDPAARIRLSYSVNNPSTGRYAAIVTDDGKFIHGGPGGFYYTPNTDHEYTISNAAITSRDYLIIWDDSRKRFSYFNFADNWYGWPSCINRPNGISNNAILTTFPEELFGQNELNSKEVLWMGNTIKSGVESGIMVVLKDKISHQLWIYNIRIGGSDKGKSTDQGLVSITKQLLQNISVDENSLFVNSAAFANQFFYTRGETLYHYNLVSMTSSQIFNIPSGNSYSHLKFRNPTAHYMVTDENNKLAIATLSADGLEGQFHEITFNQSGDLIQEVTFPQKFGPIKDLEYSFIQRIIQ
ncbi:PKD-like family lipoprotein [Sphingobacterium bovistauri]|uniref:PKD-like family protein n=1 Tax=Sphingobacterium bovistauri TaxID=2781959 RepID=A0ABS7Z0G2_9SPHI|nr:PKD-like family lipoprotein [Sphingobacterium bovistauri]MCA5003645.1 hypothetical protein [Sphingobacterium bovistauri]